MSGVPAADYIGWGWYFLAKKTQRSKSFYLLARIGISLAALAFFGLIRMDVTIGVWQRSTTYLKDQWIRYRTPAIVDAYLQSHPVRKVQLGAGTNNKEGWLNTDIEPLSGQAFLDATERFPFPDQSVHYIASEHVFEHISYKQGLGMLKESFRVLAPGGKVRVATPDLDRFVALFKEAKTPEQQKYLLAKTEWHEWPSTPDQECYILNLVLREWGHQFVYTPKLLKAGLEAAGFKDIRRYEPGVSDDPVLQRAEIRAFSNIKDVNSYETMVFEATRP